MDLDLALGLVVLLEKGVFLILKTILCKYYYLLFEKFTDGLINHPPPLQTPKDRTQKGEAETHTAIWSPRREIIDCTCKLGSNVIYRERKTVICYYKDTKTRRALVCVVDMES